MDATHLIGLHTGLKIRAIQKMKAERPDEYELTLTAALAKTLGFSSVMLEEFYEEGMMDKEVKNSLAIAKMFKDIGRLSGWEERKIEMAEQSNSLERILTTELNSHRVNGSEFSVATRVISEDVGDIKINQHISVDIFVRGRESGELLYKISLPYFNEKISYIVKNIYSDIKKKKNLILERVEQDLAKIEIKREWEISEDGFLKYIKYVMLDSNGMEYGYKEVYSDASAVGAAEHYFIIANEVFKSGEYLEQAVAIRKWWVKINGEKDAGDERPAALLARMEKYITFITAHQKDINAGYEFLRDENDVEIEIAGEYCSIIDLVIEQITGKRDLSKAINKAEDINKISRLSFNEENRRFRTSPMAYASSLIDEKRVGRDSVNVSYLVF